MWHLFPSNATSLYCNDEKGSCGGVAGVWQLIFGQSLASAASSSSLPISLSLSLSLFSLSLSWTFLEVQRERVWVRECVRGCKNVSLGLCCLFVCTDLLTCPLRPHPYSSAEMHVWWTPAGHADFIPSWLWMNLLPQRCEGVRSLSSEQENFSTPSLSLSLPLSSLP